MARASHESSSIMNAKFARFAAKLTAVTLLASTVLATGCAAPLDDDAAEDKTENLGTSQQALFVLDDALIFGTLAPIFVADSFKGDVRMTATNASEGLLAVAYCGNIKGSVCSGTVLAPGESFDRTFRNAPMGNGGLRGAILVPDNAGRCPQLNLDGQMRSWCPVSLASWNPIIGEPKIALASMTGTTATEFAFSEGGYTDVRRGAGAMDVDFFAPKKATIVPFEAQLKRSADSSGNTKEMSVTVTRVHPRQSAYNLATWFTPCNDGNKCDLINL